MSTTHRKYDVFLSFRGFDTRCNLISFFYKELVRSNILTFKDDKEMVSGQRISPEINSAIEESKFAVVVVSENYTASPWCLEELVKIMEVQNKGSLTVVPIFYGVNPSDVRRQIGKVAEHFKKYEGRQEDPEKVLSWKKALKNLADVSGYCACDWYDQSEMVDEITNRISKSLLIGKPRRNGNKLEGIDRHMEDIYQLLDVNSNETVKFLGIWARGGNGRSALAKFVYENISQHFQSHCFLDNVKRFSEDRHMPHLREEFLTGIKEQRFKNQKVLLVLDDVDKVKQLEALAVDFSCFGPGSRVIITTQDRLLLKSYGIKHVYEVDHLKFQDADLLRQPAFKRICKLFRQLSFKKTDDFAAFESDVEILCSPRDHEFIMQNCCKPLHAL